MLSSRSPKSTREVVKKLEEAQLLEEHVRRLCLTSVIYTGDQRHLLILSSYLSFYYPL